MVGIKSVIYLIVALASLLMIVATIVLPFFNTSYIGGCKRTWVCSTTAGNTCDTTTLNSSYVTGTNVCATNCMGCNTDSPKESWSTAGTGAVLLIFFMALIGIAIKFMPRFG